VSLALPASCRELDLAVVEAELVKHRCNIAAAARSLGVPASDLRRLVSWGPLAEAVLRAGLRSPDLTMRLKAASTLLKLSPAARRRGWGRGATIPRPAEAAEVTLNWRDV
jgi:hypothetical protein